MFRLTTWFLLLGTLLAVLHTVASVLFLYSYYWWFDILMHFLGGLVVMFGLGVFADLGRLPAARMLSAPLAFGVLTVVMIGWEIFEYLVPVTRADAYVLDTVTDIVLGTIGGMVGWLIARRMLRLV